MRASAAATADAQPALKRAVQGVKQIPMPAHMQEPGLVILGLNMLSAVTTVTSVELPPISSLLTGVQYGVVTPRWLILSPTHDQAFSRTAQSYAESGALPCRGTAE